ncbi:MAG: helix-turn-helix transcriptional regulator [Dyadobacter sp.]|uniref:helix-turn-helix domain-containing protein n=1 Tax=Dyadobacter sp. TaxID=1914288 RepID=UPI0032678F97
MKKIKSISEFHRLIGLPSPSHPLLSVIRLAQIDITYGDHWQGFHTDFYCIALKKDVSCAIRYGQQYYDFDTGVMSFTAPGQLQHLLPDQIRQAKGYVLLFHPDILVRHPLAGIIKGYSFFSYSVSEALHLSEKEESHIIGLLEKISEEIERIDVHTQDIVLSHIDLLLNYSKRFYDRQFLTRKLVNHELVDKFQQAVYDYFAKNLPDKNGLPTVQYIADQLSLSPNYLGDMLRVQTGQNAQQHLQNIVIEKAKQLLGITTMSVSEIAFQLGFQYAQSFNKLFKSKTQLSPLQFRSSLN